MWQLRKSQGQINPRQYPSGLGSESRLAYFTQIDTYSYAISSFSIPCMKIKIGTICNVLYRETYIKSRHVSKVNVKLEFDYFQIVNFTFSKDFISYHND